MTTHLEKQARVFWNRDDIHPEPRRAEASLKSYSSSTDLRNWCSKVEDRRQHILELITKNLSKCFGGLIPVEDILNFLLSMANSDLAKLKHCLNQLWKFIDGLTLDQQNLARLNEMTRSMDSICIEVRTADYKSEPHIAELRRQKEQASIEALLEGIASDSSTSGSRPSIKYQLAGSGKMVTKIKGLPRGFQVEPDFDPAGASHIKIRAQTSSKKLSRSSRRATSDDQSVSDQIPSPIFSPITSDTEKDLPQKIKQEKALEEQQIPADRQDKSVAADTICQEHLDRIQELTSERDRLRNKLEACLKELEDFKSLQAIASPILPNACQEEIAALEAEIRLMRSGSPSPEDEAEFIKKEVDILKRYCSKLKEIETENEKLKVELDGELYKYAQRSDDLLLADELTKVKQERDNLANKVHHMKTELSQYRDMPERLEDLRNKSELLDSVLEERDKMSEKIKSVKELEQELKRYKMKAERADELESELRRVSKDDQSSTLACAYQTSQILTQNLEKELQNVNAEKSAMLKQIESMKKELENERAKETEIEMIRLERDRLQIKLNQMGDAQGEYEEMMNKINIFDNVIAERDMFKRKYEDVLDMECKCEMLKVQVEEGRTITRERDSLKKQVKDLQSCICDQEDEINDLTAKIEELSTSKEAADNEMGKVLDSLKSELTTKDHIIVASQEQLIESEKMADRIAELQKLFNNAEHAILQKDCHIECLENQLLKYKQGVSANITHRNFIKRDLESVELMRKELAAANAENKRLQEIANKIIRMSSGDEHVKKMLKQSECVVKKICRELGKHYGDLSFDENRQKKKNNPMEKQVCYCRRTGKNVQSAQ